MLETFLHIGLLKIIKMPQYVLLYGYFLITILKESTFVTKKIIGVKNIISDKQECIYLVILMPKEMGTCKGLWSNR